MVGSRMATALVGLAVSLLISIAAYVYFGTLLLFLFVPLVPFLFHGAASRREEQPRHAEGSVRECPQCGFRTTEPSYEYCPRDGRRLVVARDRS